MMTAQELCQQIEAALEGVTEGPWIMEYPVMDAEGDPVYGVRTFPIPLDPICVGGEDDAAFIVAARTLLPDVLVELQRLTERNAELEGALRQATASNTMNSPKLTRLRRVLDSEEQPYE